MIVLASFEKLETIPIFTNATKAGSTQQNFHRDTKTKTTHEDEYID